MKATLKILLPLAILFLAFSCREPSATESFVGRDFRQSDGSYLFNIDMSDTAAAYDLRLYTKIDCTPAQFDANPDPEFVMRYTLPSGRIFSQTVTLSKGDYSRREYFSADYVFPFRQGFVPREYGLWQLRVRISNEDSITGLLGLGLEVNKRKTE